MFGETMAFFLPDHGLVDITYPFVHVLSPFEHMVKQDHMTGEVSKFTHYLQFITLEVWGRHFFGLVFFL